MNDTRFDFTQNVNHYSTHALKATRELSSFLRLIHREYVADIEKTDSGNMDKQHVSMFLDCRQSSCVTQPNVVYDSAQHAPIFHIQYRTYALKATRDLSSCLRLIHRGYVADNEKADNDNMIIHQALNGNNVWFCGSMPSTFHTGTPVRHVMATYLSSFLR